MRAHDEDHRASRDDAAAFWRRQSAAVDWFTAPTTVLDGFVFSPKRWFSGGVLNTCYNALDRHVIRGLADEPALVFHSAVTGVRQTFSYVDLLQRVAQLGGALRGLGVGPGDRVVLSLPLVPELVMAMLACARIGAVHAVVDADLSPAELAARIDDAEPQVVISASCRLEAGRVVAGKPLLDAALAEASHQPPYCVILQREQLRADLEAPRDLDFAQLMRPPIFEPAICADLAATDPLYIVYASGPAGEPHRMVRDQGGHAVALAYLMGTGYEVGVGAVVLTAADAAGVVAQSALVYGPLLVGATTVLYEGEPSDSAAFWRAVAEHRVQALVTTPARLRALAPGDFAAGGDLTTLQAVFLAGDRSDADIAGWAEKTLGVPVVEQWWPTRIGSPITTSRRPLDPTLARSGTPSVPLPGFDVVALGPDGAVLAPGQRGALCLRRPLPPGTLTTDADGAQRLAAADPLATTPRVTAGTSTTRVTCTGRLGTRRLRRSANWSEPHVGPHWPVVPSEGRPYEPAGVDYLARKWPQRWACCPRRRSP